MKFTNFTSRLRKLLGTHPRRQRQLQAIVALESLEARKLLSADTLTSSPNERLQLEIQYDTNDNLIESRLDVAGIAFWLDPVSESLVITGTTSADTIEWVNSHFDAFSDWMIRVSNDRGSGDVFIQSGMVRSMTIFAGAGDDQVDLSYLYSSIASVSVYGQAGDDFLNAALQRGGLLEGGDGNDYLWSHSAEDGFSTLNGGAGDDVVIGGSGPNLISGGDGNDDLSGSYGDDTIEGGEGDDRVDGVWGNNLLRGGNGNDTVGAAEGNDTIFGDAGDDNLQGSEGNDYVSGGEGHDLIFGQEGNDTLSGGSGDDQLFGDAGSDLMSGDTGNDLLVAGSIFLETLSETIFQITQDSNGLVSNFQFDESKLKGSSSSDRDVLYGGIGNDSLMGGNGRDLLAGEDGSDLLFGGANNDQLYGGQGNDCMRGGTGDDLMSGESGIDYLRGESGNDKIYGGSGNDFVFGGSGNDSLYGGSGSDKCDGGGGNDTVSSSQTIQGPGTPIRNF